MAKAVPLLNVRGGRIVMKIDFVNIHHFLE